MSDNNDFLFGKKAVELHLLDEKRLKNCYLIQKQSLQQGTELSIAEVMLKLRFINDYQAEMITNIIEHENVSANFVQEYDDKSVNQGNLVQEYNNGGVNSSNLVQEYKVQETKTDHFVQEYIETDFVEEYSEVNTQITNTGQKTGSSKKRNPLETKQDLFVGKETFGRYVVEKLLGKGGMGKVCLAYDPHLDRNVALKLMKVEGEDDSYTKRFLREARAIAKLNHPNIISVYDIGYDKGQFFFIMDYVREGCLKTLVNDSISLEEKISLVIKIVRAVGYAHSLEMVHRDLKPANIMLAKMNEPMVMDFGLVKLLQSSTALSRTGMLLGSLQYMPPEQATDASSVDERSDLYSIGAILYELIVGQLPFPTKTRMKLLMEIINDKPKSPHEIKADIPPELSKICLRALEKSPDDRYQTAEEFAAALEQARATCFSVKTSSPGLETARLFTTSMMGDDRKSDLKLGDTFGRYVIEQKLGEGGMGAVYQVRDQQLGRSVALKIMIGDVGEKQIKRFLLEARATASLKNPNIVEVYEIGEVPQNYFTMDLIEGRSLSALLRSKNLTARKAAIIIAKCSKALAYAHEKGIIHRDIKPSNIMMENNVEPKVMDFGLAKDVQNDNKLSKSGDVVGTPVYMSPEQADGRKIDARSDIYSLGASLYEVLTKRPPFQGESSMRLLHQIFSEDPIEPRLLNPDIPKELEAICLKCLQKKPEKRYQTAKELTKDLTNFTSNRPVSAQTITWWIRCKKTIARNKLLTTFILTIFFVLIGVIIIINNEMNITKEAETNARKAQEEERLAKEKERSAKEEAQEAQEEEKLAKEEAQESLYKTNILLADQFNENNQIKDVERVLKNIKDKRNDAEQYWEYRWQKNRKHLERKHPISKDTREIEDMDISANDYIAAIDKENVYVYSPKTKSFTNFKDRNRWLSCAISPDAKFVAASHEHNLYIWNNQTKEKIYEESLAAPDSLISKRRKPRKDRKLYNQRIVDMCFSKTGNKLLIARETIDNYSDSKLFDSLILFDMRKLEIIKKYAVPAKDRNTFANNFHACDISDDEKYIIATHENKKIYMWNIATRKLRIFQQNENKFKRISPLSRCKIHPSNKWFTAYSGREIYIFSVKKSKIVKTLLVKGYVNHCDISPDGKTLVAGCKDGTLHLWDIQNDMKYKGILTGHVRIKYCLFSHDSKKIYAGGEQGIKVWDNKIRSKPISIKLANTSKFCAIHPTKSMIAASPMHETAFTLYDSNTGEKIIKNGKAKLVGHFSGASQGRFTSTNILYTSGYDGSIIQWNLDTFDLQKRILVMSEIENFELIDNDQKIIAIGRVKKKKKEFFQISIIESLNSKPKKTNYQIEPLVKAYLESLSVEERKKRERMSQGKNHNFNSKMHAISWDKKDIVAITGRSKWVYLFDVRKRQISEAYYLGYKSRASFIQRQDKVNHYILFTSKLKNVHQYKIENGNISLMKIFVGNVNDVRHIDATKQRLVSCAKDGTIRMWPLTSQPKEKDGTIHIQPSTSQVKKVDPYFSIKNSGFFVYFTFSKDGKTLVTSEAGNQNLDSGFSFLKIWNSSPPE
ncbi:serine/threonine-protein kinase [Candidatus Uabimicrobium sp. HlEnr_7]|uniref:serine/threonine-protein kinase n=1 Tax=Candidatus Uabimicrobium helgolandensis TaxID=3095367 RepID=UPI0035571499